MPDALFTAEQVGGSPEKLRENMVRIAQRKRALPSDTSLLREYEAKNWRELEWMLRLRLVGLQFDVFPIGGNSAQSAKTSDGEPRAVQR